MIFLTGLLAFLIIGAFVIGVHKVLKYIEKHEKTDN